MTWTLALATATAQVGVALGGPDGPAAALHLRAGRRHGETLAPAVQALTGLAGVRLDELGRVAVDTGPGLFTGLRVGVATAKALATALGIPVVACASLDILAQPHASAGRPVLSVVDARRGEVFWAHYEPFEGGMAAVTEPAVASPADLLAALRSSAGDVLVTGDGARRYLEPGPGDGWTIAPPRYDHPSAEILLEVAANRSEVEPDKVTPLYLRGADVRIGWEERPGAGR